MLVTSSDAPSLVLKSTQPPMQSSSTISAFAHPPFCADFLYEWSLDSRGAYWGKHSGKKKKISINLNPIGLSKNVDEYIDIDV